MMPIASTVADPPPILEHATIRSIVIGIMLAMFLAALDQTIVATALPTIGRELGDLAHLPWVVTAYLLSATAVTPLYGKLSDIHGRRKILLIGIGIFILGSAACALATSMLALIGARALQGLGGGGLISLAQTIIADIVAPKERARYQGYFASVFVLASIAGPVLGGFFAEHLHWSMIFWINLPLGAVALWMTWGTLRQLPRHERPHRLDVLGAVLMTLATVLFLLALSWGGMTYPWGSAPIMGLLLASAVLAVLFVARLATAAEPLLPPSILLNPVVSRGTLAAFFTVGSLIGLSIYVPIYFETVLKLRASSSGVALIPLMAGVIVGATTASRLMVRIRHYKRTPAVGLLLAAGACALLSLWSGDLTLPMAEVLLGVVGIGIGTVLPVVTVAIQNSVPMHEVGTATATMNFFRSLGGAMAVAAFGAIVLSGIAGPEAGGVGLQSLSETVSRQGLDLSGVFRWVFGAAGAGLVIAFGWLLQMKELPLRSAYDRKPAPGPGVAGEQHG
jgi:EmrB/QacA subfamily drug resistance transporter